MYSILFIKFFLQGVPETAAILFSCFAMAGYKVKVKSLLKWTICMTTLLYILRMFPLTFGIHSAIGLVLVTLLIYKIAEKSIIQSFFITFTVNFLLATVEFVVLKIVSFLFDYQFTYQPTEWDWLWIISGWPQIIIMFIFGYCVYKYSKPNCFCFRK